MCYIYCDFETHHFEPYVFVECMFVTDGVCELRAYVCILLCQRPRTYSRPRKLAHSHTRRNQRVNYKRTHTSRVNECVLCSTAEINIKIKHNATHARERERECNKGIDFGTPQIMVPRKIPHMHTLTHTHTALHIHSTFLA